MEHGHAKRGNPSPEYQAWNHMKQRCLNKKDPDYINYGGRGIKVCQRWKQSFVDFLIDLGPKPSPKHSLERRDNDGNYTLSNCYWATGKQQCRNRRTNVVLTYKGKEVTQKELINKLGTNIYVLQPLVRKGLSGDEVAKQVISDQARDRLVVAINTQLGK